MINKNNIITVVGDINTYPEYSHECCGEKFYTFQIAVRRESGAVDTLPILASSRVASIEDFLPGHKVEITGDIRTYNKNDGDRKRLIIHVFAQSIDFVDGIAMNENEVEILGTICKQPVFRKTPYGKKICDLLIAVNRNYGNSDYIPSISWGRNAKFSETLQVGQVISVKGRLQSRDYYKRIGDTEEYENRTVIELSIREIFETGEYKTRKELEDENNA